MPLMESAPGAETVIDGQRYLYFAGTGYFGLQGHPEVIRAATDAMQRYGISSATSRAGFGNNLPTLDVERRAAEYFGAQAAFYYVSGYVGNGILAQGLRADFDVAFVDELAHYSVMEGLGLSGRPMVSFRHCDPADLAAKLAANLQPQQRPMLMTDGVFPSLGHIAPIPEYIEVLAHYPDALICLDDAHAGGVLGLAGRGTYDHFGLDGQPAGQPVSLYFSGTLSKAFGGQGGLITGSSELIDRLKKASHYYNGASQPAVPVAAASAKALEIVAAHPELRQRLWDNVRRLKTGLRQLGLAADDTPVPIISLSTGSGAEMQQLQQELMRRGIVIAYAREYAGLGPEGGLRVAVFSTHSDEMIDRLLAELARCL